MINQQDALHFRQAAHAGNIDEMTRLYNQNGKAILELVGAKSGRTALHQALVANQPKAVAKLLEWGANVNALDADQNTPLLLGFQCISFEALDALLKADGIDILHKNAQQNNVFMIGVQKGKPLKLRLLHDQVKKRLTQQVYKLVAAGKAVSSIDIRPDGDVVLKNEDLKDITQSIQESKYAYMTTFDGKEFALKNTRGIINESDSPIDYTLPPLVFLTRHNEQVGYHLIIDHFEQLRSLGYQAVLLEYDENVSFAELLLGSNLNAQDSTLPKLKRDEAAYLYDFLKAIETENMHFHNIDANVAALRNRTAAPLMHTDEMQAYRDSVLAKNSLKYARAYSGGVIIVLGARHVQFSENLRLGNCGQIEPFTFYDVYSTNSFIPNTQSLEDMLYRIKLSEGAGITCIQYADRGLVQASKSLMDPINHFLQKEEYTQEYDNEVDTTLLNKLKELDISFKGFTRAHHAKSVVVDALMPVKNERDYKAKQDALSGKVPGIQTTMAYTRYQSNQKQLSLIVEDINGGKNRDKVAKLNP